MLCQVLKALAAAIWIRDKMQYTFQICRFDKTLRDFVASQLVHV